MDYNDLIRRMGTVGGTAQDRERVRIPGAGLGQDQGQNAIETAQTMRQKAFDKGIAAMSSGVKNLFKDPTARGKAEGFFRPKPQAQEIIPYALGQMPDNDTIE